MKRSIHLLFPSLLGLGAFTEPAVAERSWGNLYPSIFLTTDYRCVFR
jgi:hypothetical protein